MWAGITLLVVGAFLLVAANRRGRARWHRPAAASLTVLAMVIGIGAAVLVASPASASADDCPPASASAGSTNGGAASPTVPHGVGGQGLTSTSAAPSTSTTAATSSTTTTTVAPSNSTTSSTTTTTAPCPERSGIELRFSEEAGSTDHANGALVLDDPDGLLVASDTLSSNKVTLHFTGSVYVEYTDPENGLQSAYSDDFVYSGAVPATFTFEGVAPGQHRLVVDVSDAYEQFLAFGQDFADQFSEQGFTITDTEFYGNSRYQSIFADRCSQTFSVNLAAGGGMGM